MCLRTKNHGSTKLLVPSLLLVLVVAAAWILAPGPSKAPVTAAHSDSISQAGQIPKAFEEANLEGDARPPSTLREIQLPLSGKVWGKVHAEAWVEWPSGILVELSLQKTGQVVASQGISQEFPDFSFTKVAFDNYRLTLSATGALETNQLLTLSPTSANQHTYLALQPTARVHGTVRDASGKPVVGIQVTAILRSDLPGRYHEPLLALTDEDGAYVINGLRPGYEYDLFVGTPNNPIGQPTVIGVSKSAPDAWSDFEVPLMGRAVITIDFSDGPAVRDEFGKVLRVLAQKEGGTSGYSQSLPLSKEWTATFAALPPGEYSFSVYGGAFRRVIRNAGVSSEYETALTIPVHHLGKGNRPR